MHRWRNEEWNQYIGVFDVIGMTPEILRRLLEQRILSLPQVDCIIFDECHHILGKNSSMVSKLMQFITDCDIILPIPQGNVCDVIN